MLRTVDWGRLDYGVALERMRTMRAERRRGEIIDTLILVEHPAVVTIGVEGDDGAAGESGFPVYSVERGGKSTFHGPGQLVGYPIVDLDARRRDVRAFVHELESLLIDVLAGYTIRGSHVSGRRGVWVDGQRKIASIGIAVGEWVTYHGFALNVDVDLGAFERIQPCGFDGRVMTSIAKELGRPVSLDDVRPRVIAEWERHFAVSTVAAA
ncbi:MAG: lipoyl(octanoyl) transferase LipB [Thermoplasmata archaeon]